MLILVTMSLFLKFLFDLLWSIIAKALCLNQSEAITMREEQVLEYLVYLPPPSFFFSAIFPSFPLFLFLLSPSPFALFLPTHFSVPLPPLGDRERVGELYYVFTNLRDTQNGLRELRNVGRLLREIRLLTSEI